MTESQLAVVGLTMGWAAALGIFRATANPPSMLCPRIAGQQQKKPAAKSSLEKLAGAW